jgi:hypothetical protein
MLLLSKQNDRCLPWCVWPLGVENRGIVQRSGEAWWGLSA